MHGLRRLTSMEMGVDSVNVEAALLGDPGQHYVQVAAMDKWVTQFMLHCTPVCGAHIREVPSCNVVIICNVRYGTHAQSQQCMGRAGLLGFGAAFSQLPGKG